eukprot:TRINITY_DN5448_c0_g1_i10.p2 TRINITY_DN5448_c0_g1~~TRINITY_DN5448_c0_g1_i10.p2  ORF type:complete len:137 (-),score=37.35 TRINITY_DN5448_c0_g1_i10:301-711(-)
MCIRDRSGGGNYTAEKWDDPTQTIRANKGGVLKTVVESQELDGHWAWRDGLLGEMKIRLKSTTDFIDELKGVNWGKIETKERESIVMTILVLAWLENRLEEKKKMWRLIYLKGVDWLKSKGINYEDDIKADAAKLI